MQVNAGVAIWKAIVLSFPGTETVIAMSWLKTFWKALSKPVPAEAAPVEDVRNFTPRAQQVLALARREADHFNHNFVGTEHLLLGLVALGQGTAVNVLKKLGLELENVRLEVEKQVGTGPDQKIVGNIPYTPRVKKVLALAAKEAKELNHTFVGTEHILLGLLREGDGVAARVLINLGVDIEHTRQEILRELDPNFSPSPGETGPSSVKATTSQRDAIDTSRRYDVYCTERNQEVVVYRNALFKGIKKLFPNSPSDFRSEFMELEQADGRTVFLARSSVIKFCEHGTTPNAEPVSGNKP